MKEQKSHIFGFADRNGEPYDFHVSKDLQNKKTLESINFKFSLPQSKYVLIWKKDRTKFKKREVDEMVNYVKKVMSEFTDDGEKTINVEENKNELFSILLPTKECIIITYGRIILPEGNINWKNYADIVSISIDDMIEK